MDDSQIAAELNHNSVSTTGDNVSSPPAVEAELAAITKAIFGVPGEFETCWDPEDPDCTWRVINLDFRDLDTIRAKKREWYRRVISELGERAMGYSLSVYPVADDG
jgi:hypothetical protein